MMVNDMRERQRRVGRIANKHGLTFKAISLDSGIPLATVYSYFSGGDAETHILPVTALASLFGVLPDDWLSILFEPEGRCITQPTTDDGEALAAMQAARDALDAQIKRKAPA